MKINFASYQIGSNWSLKQIQVQLLSIEELLTFNIDIPADFITENSYSILTSFKKKLEKIDHFKSQKPILATGVFFKWLKIINVEGIRR